MERLRKCDAIGVGRGQRAPGGLAHQPAHNHTGSSGCFRRDFVDHQYAAGSRGLEHVSGPRGASAFFTHDARDVHSSRLEDGSQHFGGFRQTVNDHDILSIDHVAFPEKLRRISIPRRMTSDSSPPASLPIPICGRGT